MAAQTEGKNYKLILVGKKAIDYFRFRNYKIEASFTDMTDTPLYEDARSIATKVREIFVNGDVDQVILAYQEFVSMGTKE